MIENRARLFSSRGFYPVHLVDQRTGELVDDLDSMAAEMLAGRSEVSIVYVQTGDDRELTALRLERHNWVRTTLQDDGAVDAAILEILAVPDDLIELIGVGMSEIDKAISAAIPLDPASEAEIEDLCSKPAAEVSVSGDIWDFDNGSSLGVIDTRDADAIAELCNGRKAAGGCHDGPFGRSVAELGVSSQTEEWRDGVGFTEAQVHEQHLQMLSGTKPHLLTGAAVILFSDRHSLQPIRRAVIDAGFTEKNLAAWDKTAMAMGGSWYRNQLEWAVIAKLGKAPGYLDGNRRMRRRSNLWSVAGYNTFRHDRAAALANHACTKPQDLLMDLYIDLAPPGGAVLDMFSGSGSGLLAGYRTKRRVFAGEISPAFCDIAIRRLFAESGAWPTLRATGQRFDEVAKARGIDWPADFVRVLHGGDW